MQYTIELEIDKPRDELWALFEDPESLPFWQPGFVSIEHIGGEKNQPGCKSRMLYKNRGRDVELIETIEAFDPPREFTAKFEAKGMEILVKSVFEEIDGGDRTRWISENEGKTSGFFMKLIGILMPGCFKKESMKYNQAFKAFAETGADVREAG
jgi:uncharacterized protein YndB with AHSA1/START domain